MNYPKSLRSDFLVICLLVLGLNTWACYSFKGIDIPDNVQTFYINEISNRARTAPADLGQTFTESLKDKILTESKLTFNDINPDIEFSGEITRFRASSQAPQRGETTAFNRLDISVRISYKDNQNEKASWENSFSFYSDFGSNENLLDRQDELISVIFEQILEDIFNKAFTSW